MYIYILYRERDILQRNTSLYIYIYVYTHILTRLPHCPSGSLRPMFLRARRLSSDRVFSWKAMFSQFCSDSLLHEPSDRWLQPTAGWSDSPLRHSPVAKRICGASPLYISLR